MIIPSRAAPPFLPRNRAHGTRRPGEMNKLEASYAEHLGGLMALGDVIWFKFEAIKFRLAPLTYYTPDFIVLTGEEIFEAHEVKGFWQDDARVKIKVAAELYPIVFKAFKPLPKKRGGGWEQEVF